MNEFDEIRPYHDEELPRIFDELIADPAFRQVAASVFPEIPIELMEHKMRGSKTKRDFDIINNLEAAAHFKASLIVNGAPFAVVSAYFPNDLSIQASLPKA